MDYGLLNCGITFMVLKLRINQTGSILNTGHINRKMDMWNRMNVIKETVIFK